MAKMKNRLFETNNFSIVSKYSAVKRGYFEDKILEEFMETHLNNDKFRRTPLVNRGYAARLWAVYKAVNEWRGKSQVKDCIIILGAGYDFLPFHPPRPLYWTDSCPVAINCNWIEIDLPEVVDIKAKFIRESKLLNGSDLREIEEGIFHSFSLNYTIIACDLRNTTRLAHCLKVALPKIDTRRRIAILNEVCLCYLEEVRDILHTVIKSLEFEGGNIHYFGYEPVKVEEDRPLGQLMIDHFESLGYPLKHFLNPKQIKDLLISVGFEKVEISSMYNIYKDLFEDVPINIKDLEPFDEYEEMDSYLSHYALVEADIFCSSFKLKFTKGLGYKIKARVKKEKFEKDDKNYLRSSFMRYGHSSCLLEDNFNGTSSVIVSGGFGINTFEHNKQHKRLGDCAILDITGNEFSSRPLSLAQFPVSTPLDRMHGQVIKIAENKLFFYGGRQSPIYEHGNNFPFIASIDGDQLVQTEAFQTTGYRWRHKLCRSRGDEIVLVGGIGENDQNVELWNFNTCTLRRDAQVQCNSEYSFNRHSFGMDIRDETTLLIYGGLSTDPKTRDKPISNYLLWDMRSPKVNKVRHLNTSSSTYGSDVHFISENQIACIGGISTAYGLDNCIQIVDIRTKGPSQLLLEKKEVDVGHGLMMLTNATSCRLDSKRKIVSIGGGGNYFTFGTHFNSSYMVYKYSSY